jgi:Prophage maintenance system killer protein
MIKYSKERVLLLHQMIIAETGGTGELRDIGLLESALAGVYSTFDGQELYPTKEEKPLDSVLRLFPTMHLRTEISASGCMSC